MEDWQLNLVTYGTHLLASQLGQEFVQLSSQSSPASLMQEIIRRGDVYREDPHLRLAREIIYDNDDLKPHAQVQPVTSIFNLLSLPAMPLHLPKTERTQLEEPTFLPEELWTGFQSKLNKLTLGIKFEAFFHLLTYYGRTVPGTIADPARSGFEDGLSVSEQFKAVAALCHCLDPDNSLGQNQPLILISGDLPGIQQILYTLTSRGAAKTLRGRSVYLQLLGDVIIRYILRALNLSWANVIFNAGGNFMLLAPSNADSIITGLEQEINRKLLYLHRGELYLALAHTPIAAHLITDTSHYPDIGTLSYARKTLHDELVAAKDAAFASLMDENTAYHALFDPFGKGGPAYRDGEKGNLCAICHTEIDLERGTAIPIPSETPAVGKETGKEIELVLCEQCHSLGSHRVPEDHRQEILPFQLARAIILFIQAKDPSNYQHLKDDQGNPPWDEALAIFGFKYTFWWPGKKDQPTPPTEEEGYLLYLDEDGFDVAVKPGVIAGVWTPTRLTPWQNEAQDTIRDFHVMARCDATGLPRYGVLRMDVDNLGRILLGSALPFPDLLHLSALSTALDTFFGRRLERICRQVVADWREQLKKILLSPEEIPDGAGQPDNVPDPSAESLCQKVSFQDCKLPYIIYAGGDDLFIVGPWDILPPLAQAIRLAFDRYTQSRLTMSAGISLAREKYPLYKSAEDAGSDLDQSKGVPGKNAITFLGKTLTWANAAKAQATAFQLAKLIEYGQEDGDKRVTAPHALLSTLGYVAHLYHIETGPEEWPPADTVALGRWLWALHYGLRRLGQRVQPLQREIYALVGNVILDINNLDTARTFQSIRFLGLAVRWAEFLIRKGDSGQ